MNRLKSAVLRYGVMGMLQNVSEKLAALVGIRVARMCIWAHESRSVEVQELPEYRELEYADFERHATEDPNWFTPVKMQKLARYYLVPGNRAFGCFVKGRLAAYGWISERYLGCSKRLLESGDGYLWDAYTHPDFRGQGWHSKLIRLREDELRRAGKVRFLSIILSYNRASYRAYQSSGYAILSRYRFGRIWGKPFSTFRYGVREK